MEATDHIETVIDRMVRRLVNTYEPERIILFGSRASGAPTQDSDVDMLVVKETAEQGLERLLTVRRFLTGTHTSIPVDVIVMTPDEIEERLRIGHSFVADILENGRVLYGSKRVRERYPSFPGLELTRDEV